jgi:hypothetical protein
VPRAIVFLIAARAFVFFDDVALVLVDGEASGNAGLLVRSHPEPVAVQRRPILDQQRRPLANGREILPRRRIYLR